MYPQPNKRETGAQLLEGQRHQNGGVQNSKPILRTLRCDPWVSLLLPVPPIRLNLQFILSIHGDKRELRGCDMF